MRKYVFVVPLIAVQLGAAVEPNSLVRELVLTPQPGTSVEDVGIARCQAACRHEREPAKNFVRLARAYIAKARASLDAGCYALAEKSVEVAEGQSRPTDETALLRGCIAQNLHRFADAERIARQLTKTRGAPEDFALLSDALIDQGRVAEGVIAIERLVMLRPGPEAYTRIAHVRWLKGDLTGAIGAMQTAGRAAPVDASETQAWIACRLSGYFLQQGGIAQARAAAEAALRHAPDFPPAWLALGRSLLAAGALAEATEPLRRAAEACPVPEYQWWLADALRAVGRADEAANVEAQLRARGAATDPRTLALFLATRGREPAFARRLAESELTRRQDVFTHDAVAWARGAAGDWVAAAEAMKRALAEPAADGRLSLHAGEVAYRHGQFSDADRHFAAAAIAAGTLTPSERALLDRRTGELSRRIAHLLP